MKPTYEELAEALVAVVTEDCSDANSATLFATLPAEIAAIRILERIGKVRDIRISSNGHLRAYWVKDTDNDSNQTRNS